MQPPVHPNNNSNNLGDRALTIILKETTGPCNSAQGPNNTYSHKRQSLGFKQYVLSAPSGKRLNYLTGLTGERGHWHFKKSQ